MKQISYIKASKDRNDFERFLQILRKSWSKTLDILPMKSIKLFCITSIMVAFLWSCDFLDYNELDQFDEDAIFAYIDRTKNILTNIYSYLPNDFMSIDGAMRSSATDEAKHVWETSNIQKFNDGSWNSLVTVDDQWSKMYKGIRAVNVFLEDAKGLTFENIKYNDNYKDLMTAFKVYPYEARFLRAFLYFELIKRYGSVPLDTVRLTIEDAKKGNPQASFEDIVKYIVRECDSAITKLPVTYATPTFVSGETGRATKGAAMALKARTLLYAASPLHNPSNDASKWTSAANASKAIIDQLGHLGNNTYSPLPAYTSAVNNRTSKELIFERREAAARTFESANTAIGFVGGNTGTCPTQNLVDSYEMKSTGKGINEVGSGYDPANPYATTGAAARDPRLEVTILHNGSVWKTPLVVETWYGGLNAPPKVNASRTGYYLKKYMIESISLNPVNPGTAIHYWIIFRYGEVLLNYAEAMNEVFGPEVTGPAPLNNLTALQAVNIVRARTGVAMPAFPAGMSQASFRDKLRNERRVELAFEDHRFWDIRRWKIGPSTIDIRGMNITKDAGTGLLTYTPNAVETRIWNDKMYLYPIPQSEIFLNDKLIQNPGW